MTRSEAIAIRQAQLSGKPVSAEQVAKAISVLSVTPKLRRDRRRTIENPWGLSKGMCEALDGLARHGTALSAASELGLDPCTIDAQVHRAKDRMGVEHRLLAVLEWDRFARSNGERKAT